MKKNNIWVVAFSFILKETKHIVRDKRTMLILLGMRDITNSKADLILVIPHGAERDAVRGEQPQLLIAANSVNGTKGSLGASYLSQTAVMGAAQMTKENSKRQAGAIAPLYLSPSSG